MANFSAMRAVCAVGAIWLHYVALIAAFGFDLTVTTRSLSSNAFVACHKDLQVSHNGREICPSHVGGTRYVWHPQPPSGNGNEIYTYVGENEKLRSVPLSDVVLIEGRETFLWMEYYRQQTQMVFTMGGSNRIVFTDNRFMFICGPKDLVLSEELQRQIYLFSSTKKSEIPWDAQTPLVQEIAKIGKGLGVVYMNRGRVNLPFQGCGSRPSRLFAPDNEVTVDPVTGTRSCVVNPMSQSTIGFVCEGVLEPKNCMYDLLVDGVVTRVPRPRYAEISSSYQPWVSAKYFNNLAIPSFSGECRCTDPTTGAIKAKMEIRSKNDYVCDISSMIERSLSHPIRGPWCSVVLHPGSTLTIRFPKESLGASSANEFVVDKNGQSPPDTLTQTQPGQFFETDFAPKDLTKLRQEESVYDLGIYKEVPYHSAIAGDALELDVSQMNSGEVKLIYHPDEPMTLLGGPNSFGFHWTSIHRNANIENKIRATVNVAFAFTHEYNIIGSDRGPHAVFSPKSNETNCSVTSMGNGIGDVHECKVYIDQGSRWTGIHCRPGEELLPTNCQSKGYDLTKNRIISIPESVQNETPHHIVGFQLFSYRYIDDSPVSYACSCVDQRGYEKSRLVIESYQYEKFTLTAIRTQAPHRVVPYVVLPWREVDLSTDEFAPPTSLMLYNIRRRSTTLQPGKTLAMTCGVEENPAKYGDIRCDCPRPRIDKNIPATWLPNQTEEFYYSMNETDGRIEVVKSAYADTIAASPGGFSVGYQSDKNAGKTRILVIKSILGAILISKNPTHKKYVPMTFICGKAPETSELSVMPGDASTANASAQPTSNTMALSLGYMWNVVEVKVEMTDPYRQGCGVTYGSAELFKPETPKLYNAEGQEIGCKIDLRAARKAAFYCPTPYAMDPPNCFNQVYVEDEVKNLSDVSKSLVASRTNHFVTLKFDGSQITPRDKLRQTPLLECRCVTTKGVVLSTIQIENYYAR
ncbi:hypothetical protein BBBOND_0305950 [Babesia bigemina]|uniref:6-Cys domain-containing protein n=1 Tax=Babesia bigemina TaxID=5866 RepID=A0A061D7M0_BABBI|nr:hypothetical protein BBBOND_0305950 [Babesia bigemina]CDR96691.1 hypothetical protein BBBOND_0305950 [Babesia bigemina]|eukprot:XP_012768877.1 hypothetical protein BBBOND_0305950 [Babesia bigemina]